MVDQNVITRMEAAEQWLVDMIRQQGDCSEADAQAVADVYKKHRVVKRDAVMGRYTFKHGVFLDTETIQGVIENVVKEGVA